jgi:hypothetical protein
MSDIRLWEILVPTIMRGKPIHTRYHRVWDAKVRNISGGLTILKPVKGQWVYQGDLHDERMIPVRIRCTAEQIEKISDITADYYEQKAIMYYAISDTVVVKHYDDVDKACHTSTSALGPKSAKN